jgi:hypothetical protein
MLCIIYFKIRHFEKYYTTEFQFHVKYWLDADLNWIQISF